MLVNYNDANSHFPALTEKHFEDSFVGCLCSLMKVVMGFLKKYYKL